MTPTDGEIYAYNRLRYGNQDDPITDLDSDPNKYEKAGDHFIEVAHQILEERGEPDLEVHELNKAAHELVRLLIDWRAAGDRNDWPVFLNLGKELSKSTAAYQELLAKESFSSEQEER